MLKQVDLDDQFMIHLQSLVTPGATLILTNAAVNISTLSKSEFQILTVDH